jgi:hypothetical protein
MLFLIVLPVPNAKLMTLTQTLPSLATDLVTCKHYDKIAALEMGDYLELDYRDIRFVVVRIQ